MIETNILDERERERESVKNPVNRVRGEKKVYERLKTEQRFVGGA